MIMGGDLSLPTSLFSHLTKVGIYWMHTLLGSELTLHLQRLLMLARFNLTIQCIVLIPESSLLVHNHLDQTNVSLRGRTFRHPAIFQQGSV